MLPIFRQSITPYTYYLIRYCKMSHESTELFMMLDSMGKTLNNELKRNVVLVRLKLIVQIMNLIMNLSIVYDVIKKLATNCDTNSATGTIFTTGLMNVCLKIIAKYSKVLA